MRHDVLVLSLLGLALLVAAGSEAAAPEATILQIDPQEVDKEPSSQINFDGDFFDGDDDHSSLFTGIHPSMITSAVATSSLISASWVSQVSSAKAITQLRYR